MPTVLVIDDDPAVLDSLRALMEAHGFTVEVAGSARQAATLLAFGHPDLILTDIYMPDGDGYELLQRVGTAVPVIAISGGDLSIGGHDHLEIARKLGAAATVAKPFRTEDLLKTINRVIGGDQREIGHGSDPDGG